MNPDKLHKFMDFTINVVENTVIQMFGNAWLSCLISYHLLLLSRINSFVFMEGSLPVSKL